MSGVNVGPAQSQTIKAAPSEWPNPKYRGGIYVDTTGCVYLRALTAAGLTWEPRLTPDDIHMCGYSPTGSAAMPYIKSNVSLTSDVSYEGNWKDSKKHGFGRLVFSNGDFYNGFFKFGESAGPGKLAKNNNGKFEVIDQIYFAGKFISTETELCAVATVRSKAVPEAADGPKWTQDRGKAWLVEAANRNQYECGVAAQKTAQKDISSRPVNKNIPSLPIDKESCLYKAQMCGERQLCQLAIKDWNWETKEKYIGHVTEAAQRGLNLFDCAVAMGVDISKIKVIFGQGSPTQIPPKAQ